MGSYSTEADLQRQIVEDAHTAVSIEYANAIANSQDITALELHLATAKEEQFAASTAEYAAQNAYFIAQTIKTNYLDGVAIQISGLPDSTEAAKNNA